MALDSRPFIPVAAEWLRYQANEPDAVEDLAIELREAYEAGAAAAFGLMGMAFAIQERSLCFHGTYGSCPSCATEQWLRTTFADKERSEP